MVARKFARSGRHALKKMLAFEIHIHSLLSGCKSKSIQPSKQSERTKLAVMWWTGIAKRPCFCGKHCSHGYGGGTYHYGFGRLASEVGCIWRPNQAAFDTGPQRTRIQGTVVWILDFGKLNRSSGRSSNEWDAGICDELCSSHQCKAAHNLEFVHCHIHLYMHFYLFTSTDDHICFHQ